MRMKKLLVCALLFLQGMALSAFAQENNATSDAESVFTIGAQLRTRAEYRNGVLNPRSEGASPAGFVNERARLSLGFERNNLSLKLSAQHVGVWGQDAMIDKNGRFILNEAWARLKIGDAWALQLGRQTLAYDDERILGALDWNVAGRYHDALKVEFNRDGHSLHGIFAFNQNDEKVIGGSYYDNSQTKLYKTMQTLWYHYQSNGSTPFGISLLAMNIGQEGGTAADAKTKFMQTFGTHITLKPGDWNLTGSFYYQSGKTVASRSISAYMGSVKVIYAINPTWAVNIGTDYLSGSKDATGKYKAFNPLYGTHHKFYGSMDYFYASDFVAGYAPGLSDTQLGVSYKVSPKVSMSLNYHYFATGVKLDGLKRTLGSEIDYQLDWKIMKDVSFTFGYSTMFGSSTMDVVKGGSHKSWQDWAWISLNINPQIFSFRK